MKGTLACRGETVGVSVLVTGGICVCASGAAACSLGRAAAIGLRCQLLEEAGGVGLWCLSLEAGQGCRPAMSAPGGRLGV